jgi:hemerythrin
MHMPLITWSSEYSLEIKEIDVQHQKLVGMINQLHDAMKEGKGKDILQPIINSLVEYTRSHFGREEQLFAQYGYTARDGHTKIHNTLTQQALDLKDKIDKGTGIMAVEVMSFMKSWLTNHILAEDRKYAPFLKSKGVN